MGPKRKELAQIPDQNEDLKMRIKRQKAESSRKIANKRKVDQYGECVAGLITKTFKINSNAFPPLPSRPKNKKQSTGNSFDNI